MIKEEYNPTNGLFLYSVICDDCEESLPARGSMAIAIVDAVASKWLMRKPIRKFSGTALSDFCPKCRKKHNVRNE